MSNLPTHKIITNVRWSDTDKYGHVNNGKYFDYFEEARTDWVYSNEALLKWSKENNIQLVIAEQCCKYIAPLNHPNKIEVIQTIIKCGVASIDLTYTINIVGSDQIITKSNVKLACYNESTARIQKIPNELKEIINSNE